MLHIATNNPYKAQITNTKNNNNNDDDDDDNNTLLINNMKVVCVYISTK